ncbi:hypothetical protein GCM10010191_78150 [Actinomadura vinacea]|uniref:Uncharacterized protein n=1 Tax=Actinomadura vinacea TaxID=115336 RepID=A0ABP5X916_9ACTN
MGGQKVRFTLTDRALPAALLHRLTPEALRRMRLLVRPDAVLRWHRDLIAGRHAARSRPKRPGRPPVRSIRVLLLRLVPDSGTRVYFTQSNRLWRGFGEPWSSPGWNDERTWRLDRCKTAGNTLGSGENVLLRCGAPSGT